LQARLEARVGEGRRWGWCPSGTAGGEGEGVGMGGSPGLEGCPVGGGCRAWGALRG
jgi:hypothetical protein